MRLSNVSKTWISLSEAQSQRENMTQVHQEFTYLMKVWHVCYRAYSASSLSLL